MSSAQLKAGCFFFVGYREHRELLHWEPRAKWQKLHDDHSLTSGEYRPRITNIVAKTGNCPSSQKPLGQRWCPELGPRTTGSFWRGASVKETETPGTFSVKMQGFSGTCFLQVGVEKNSPPLPFSIITAIKIKQM